MMPASILALFAAAVAGVFASAEGWPKGQAPSPHRRRWLGSLLLIGLASGLALSVATLGWVAGLVSWALAIMLSGIGVVALASVHPALTRRLGIAAGAGAFLLTVLSIGGT
jgi:hypothetical protein